MEFPVGLGGVTLVVAAVVWLIAFVPGYTQRSQIDETSKFVKQQQRDFEKSQPVTKDDQLRRLINTQRGFSVLFGLGFLATTGFGIASFIDNGFVSAAIAAAVLAGFGLLVSRAAARSASKIASSLHKNRLEVRSAAQKRMPAATREWTPNPLPAPLATLPKLEPIEAPIAEVISIDKPRKVFSGSEIDQILARRRAI